MRTHRDSAKLQDSVGRTYEVSIEIITPDAAARYLAEAAGNGNRTIKTRHMQDKLAADLANGLWEVNGETVSFDYNGVLREGHHRMQAVCVADTPMETFVVRGIRPEVTRTIDTGVSRTARDVFSMEDEANAATMASAAKAYLAWRDTGFVATKAIPVYSPSAQDELRRSPQGEDLRVAVRKVKAWFATQKGQPRLKVWWGLYAVIYLAFTEATDSDTADAFFELVSSPYGHSQGDPELALRGKLTTLQAEKQPVTDFTLAYMFVTAWNARRLGEKRVLTKLPSVDLRELPAIRGLSR